MIGENIKSHLVRHLFYGRKLFCLPFHWDNCKERIILLKNNAKILRIIVAVQFIYILSQLLSILKVSPLLEKIEALLFTTISVVGFASSCDLEVDDVIQQLLNYILTHKSNGKIVFPNIFTFNFNILTRQK
jgi:hypothetical protein